MGIIQKKKDPQGIFFLWYGREDLNLHTLRHQLLKLACLPIPPRPRDIELSYFTQFFYKMPALRRRRIFLKVFHKF
jgi:hypothetical protein